VVVNRNRCSTQYVNYVNIVEVIFTMQNNNFVFYSKDSTYYQGKIIMQQIESVGCKKDQAGCSENIFFVLK